MSAMNGNEQVLIAEDDPNDAFFIKRAFLAAGLKREPFICKNGVEAIAYLKGAGIFADREVYPYPKWIMTDLKMPIADGFKVLSWLKDHPDLRIIPTIVFTSSADEKDAKRAYCLGAHGYIIKPSQAVEFKNVISCLVNFWGSCERPSPEVPPSCDELLLQMQAT